MRSNKINTKKINTGSAKNTGDLSQKGIPKYCLHYILYYLLMQQKATMKVPKRHPYVLYQYYKGFSMLGRLKSVINGRKKL